jgi:predicted HicB family RNase H-like nuclease
MRERALRKPYWGKVMTVSLDQGVHKRLALYAADYGLSATLFVPHIITQWVLKMDRKGLTK